MTKTSTQKKKKKNKKDAKGKGKKRKKQRRSARTSDRHELYELSVQNPEAEGDFIDQVWKERRGRVARSIREDFCGTAAAAIEWVRRRPDNTAIAVDIDPSVLSWGESKLAERLNEEQRTRLTLRRADVMTVRTPPVDSVLAMNFSYYLFKARRDMVRYFKGVRESLVADGLFLLDAYGGSDAFAELQEKRRIDGFTYVWDQELYNPITGQAINRIHYRFPDGTELKNAFTYDWRLWTLPEIREMLAEAGFDPVTVYWEGTDEKTGEGNDEFTPSDRGEACPGWIAYIVAER